jgi:hypothetical protein
MVTKRTAELIAERRLERVPVDARRANALLIEAARHLESAITLVDRDREGAYSLAYDAVRKAIVAHMTAHGIRATSAPRAHAAVVEYAESELAAAVKAGVLGELDRMRTTRNASEYSVRSIGAQELAHDIEIARDVVRSMVSLLTQPRSTD